MEVKEFIIPGKRVDRLENPMVIGRIARPVGLKGEMKITGFSESVQYFLDQNEIILQLPDEFRKIKITNCYPSGKWLRIKAEGVDSPEHASILNGAEIVIPSKERPEKEEGDYYIDDLIGCSVVSDLGDELGFLVEVLHQGHHDLWVVEGGYGEVLIPAVKSYISDVNIEKHLITVKYIEGLWDSK
ncbi:16S rRNA processing protein RimM [bacterium]|nr:16S rRNA processing protein RimM [bacterium]